MNRKFKRKHLFDIEIYCNIINVFTVTFDQFNASLMNKSINFNLKSPTETVAYNKCDCISEEADMMDTQVTLLSVLTDSIN